TLSFILLLNHSIVIFLCLFVISLSPTPLHFNFLSPIQITKFWLLILNAFNMSSSAGLRARSNCRRHNDSDIFPIKKGKPLNKNENVDRRDFQNMGGIVEDHRRRSSSSKLNSNLDKSHDDPDIWTKKRGKPPQEKKEKIDRKDIQKLGNLVKGLNERCSHRKRKFIIHDSDDDNDRNDIKLGVLVEGLHKRCSRRKRKFIIRDSDDDNDRNDNKMGGPIKERRGTCSRMILINDSDDDYHVLPRKCGKSDDRNDNPPSEKLFLENVASLAGSALVKPNGDNLDMAWEWNSLKDISNKRAVTCDFCLKTTNGGITRAKKHQIGLEGDVSACKKIPPSIKLKIKQAYEKKKAVKFGLEEENDDDEVEATEEINLRAGKRRAKGSITQGSIHGHMNTLKIIELSNKLTLGMAKRKTCIRDASIKKARAKANRCIAQFIRENEIPFEVACSKGFKMMIEAVGDYGQQLNPPSYHKLRAPLLKEQSELTKEKHKPHEIEQTQYGEAIEDEPVVEPLRLTCGVVDDAIKLGEPSRLTIEAPIEEEKEEAKQEENPKPKPEINKRYARKSRRDNALVQV
ncbi:hypothetical protein D0Y65_038362, partial [Glycine soja]